MALAPLSRAAVTPYRERRISMGVMCAEVASRGRPKWSGWLNRALAP
jgi:hypothetical protein